MLDPLAGKPAPIDRLVDVAKLRREYFERRIDPSDPKQRVRFGTSGHRGSSLDGSFNEAHILATTQAVIDYRTSHGITGPLFLAKDTHALSAPAFATAVEVLAGNGVETRIDSRDGFTPTPVLSHAILVHNRGRTSGLADGIVITPSHNPPEDGGFKYNPPSGGPAGTEVTRWIERAANEHLANGLARVKRVGFEKAVRAPVVQRHDYVTSYVADLASVIDMDVIRGARLRVGADPLGGASVGYWGPIAEHYGIGIDVVSTAVDPTFRFMTLDWDGKIRMDCSSPYAMARLIGIKDRFDLAFGNDTDADRHGIVTPREGLMNPNHYLAAAIEYLFTHRPQWRSDGAIGKTVVSSRIIDGVAKKLGRALVEVPVGFKWFVAGLQDGSLCFGGEESAGASILRRDGSVWTTDKDGIVLALLAVEMTARTGKDPSALYEELTRTLGAPVYERIDAPASNEQRAALLALRKEDVALTELAGDAIESVLTNAPGNNEPIGGVKVSTAQGWFAARPSGTEDVYKLYAESFRGADHLRRIQEEAKAFLGKAMTR
jgi:phosphoglucomutase